MIDQPPPYLTPAEAEPFEEHPLYRCVACRSPWAVYPGRLCEACWETAGRPLPPIKGDDQQ